MAAFPERNWEPRRGGRSASDESSASYYNVPVIHKPHWKWLIIVYFFLGGISGASYVIATLTELIGGRDGQRIARVGRYLSLATLIPSPILLILDLGRPERFHHMLRIVKLRSPMSVGTWGLTIFSAFCGLSALVQAAQDGIFERFQLLNRVLLAAPSKPINALGAVFGSFVGGYTGVLLAVTAVPLWAKNYLLLGPLFLSSALTNATATITLVLALMRNTPRRTFERLERLELIAVITELVLLLAVRVHAGPVIARPLREGHLGRVYRWLVLGVGISAPLTLVSIGRLWPGHRVTRLLTPLAALLGLIGGQSFRYLIVMAGRASADDPQATFEFARRKPQSPDSATAAERR